MRDPALGSLQAAQSACNSDAGARDFVQQWLVRRGAKDVLVQELSAHVQQRCVDIAHMHIERILDALRLDPHLVRVLRAGPVGEGVPAEASGEVPEQHDAAVQRPDGVLGRHPVAVLAVGDLPREQQRVLSHPKNQHTQPSNHMKGKRTLPGSVR